MLKFIGFDRYKDKIIMIYHEIDYIINYEFMIILFIFFYKKIGVRHMATNEEIRAFIKQGREALGMTQRDFAEKIGFSAALLSYIENGKKEITPKYENFLKNIAELLKCDWRDLIPEKPPFPKLKTNTQTLEQKDNTPADSIDLSNPEYRKLEEMNDLAMLNPVNQILKLKVYVEVKDEKPEAGDVVKIRNRLTGDIAFRYLSKEAGCYFLKPLNPNFEVFQYDENGKFEILGVIHSFICKKLV